VCGCVCVRVCVCVCVHVWGRRSRCLGLRTEVAWRPELGNWSDYVLNFAAEE
jgi:hypothetical protein